MTAISFSKQNYQITIRITYIFFISHIFLCNLMNLAAIFQSLKHLSDFEISGYDCHFVFQNEAKILHRQVFIAINIPSKFGENVFISE